MRSRHPAPDTLVPALRHAPGGAMGRQAWRLVWTLVLAIALAPLLGQMHRVVHLGSIAGAANHGVPAGQPASLSVGDWVHALFDGHGPADCQLLDQYHHGLAGPPAAVALPGVWAAHVLAHLPAGVHDGRMRVAFFHARAPPLAITAALTA